MLWWKSREVNENGTSHSKATVTDSAVGESLGTVTRIYKASRVIKQAMINQSSTVTTTQSSRQAFRELLPRKEVGYFCNL